MKAMSFLAVLVALLALAGCETSERAKGNGDQKAFELEL